MKKRNSFYNVLLVAVSLLPFSCLMCISWEKPQEPRTIEDAQKMRKEGKEEKEKAIKQKEEAAKEKDNEEALKDADFKYQEALYKNRLGTMKEAEILEQQATDPKIIEKQKNIITKAREDLAYIENKINFLQKELSSAYQMPIEPMKKQFSDVRDLGHSINEFIREQIATVEGFKDKDLPNYLEQKNALISLRDVLNKEMSAEEEEKYLKNLDKSERDDYFEKRIKIIDRLNEIIEFEKNPPKSLINNVFDKTFAFSKYIPSDQVKILTKELPKILIGTDIATLRDVVNIIDHYKLGEKNSELAQVVTDRLENLKPKKEIEIPAKLKQMEDTTKLLSDPINNAAKLAEQLTLEKSNAETIGEYVSWTKEVFTKGLNYAAKEILIDMSQSLAESAKGVSETAKTMESVPQLLTTLDKTANAIQEQVVAHETLLQGIGMLPSEKAMGITKKIKQLNALAKKVTTYKKALTESGKTIGEAGRLVGSIAEVVEDASKLFEGWAEKYRRQPEKEQIRAQKFLDEASLLVKQAEENILSAEKQKESKYAKIVEPVFNAAKTISTWFKDLFKKAEPTLVQAQSDYESARRDYLTILDLDPADNPSADQIKAKIKMIAANDTPEGRRKKNILDGAGKKLATQSTNLAKIFNDVLNNAEGAGNNYKWLVDGMSDVSMAPRPRNIVDLVNNVADLRDMRLAYLQAARIGVDFMKEDTKDVSKETVFLDLKDSFVNSLSAMVNNQTVESINEYAKVLSAIDKSINQEQMNLDNFVKEQQSASIPEEEEN